MKKKYLYLIAIVTFIFIAFILSSGVLNSNSRFIGKWEAINYSSSAISDFSISMVAPNLYVIFNQSGELELRYEHDDATHSYSIYGTYDVISSTYITLTVEGESVTFSYVFSNNNCILTLTDDDGAYVTLRKGS